MILTNVDILLFTKIENVNDENPIIKNINVIIRTAKTPIKFGNATKNNPRMEIIKPRDCRCDNLFV